MRERAAADIEAAKAAGRRRPPPEVAALAIGAAEVVVQRNLDRATQVQLIENYINPGRRAGRTDRGIDMSEVTQALPTNRIDAYAEALFEVARAEGILGEVEDELFRFARVLEAPTSCATR